MSVLDLPCEPIRLDSIVRSTWRSINFKVQYQEKSNWCWAAMALSVAKFYDSDFKYTQSDIANGELDRTDCSKEMPDDPCNKSGYLMSSLNRVDHFETWYVRRPKKSSRLQDQVRRHIEHEIRKEINHGRPLCARIAWVGGGAHFVGIYGYAADSADSKLGGVAIADPLWGLSDVDWEDFPVRYRVGGTYTDSYHTS